MKYCISDIHGCLKTFNKLLKKINFSKKDTLYILGDTIDRGPDSAGVVQRILDLRSEGFKIKAILGNHEVMMLQSSCLPDLGFHSDKDSMNLWIRNGGKSCLESYRVDNYNLFWEELPVDHRNFFTSLPYYINIPGYILVHAGLKFSENRDDRLMELMYNIKMPPITNPLKQTSQQDMVWLRDFKVNPEMMKNKILVTGHTPTPLFTGIWDIKEELEEKKHIIIDGGCWYTDHKDKGFGYLVAFRLDDHELFWEENYE